jgi:hypothetical protein
MEGTELLHLVQSSGKWYGLCLGKSKIIIIFFLPGTFGPLLYKLSDTGAIMSLLKNDYSKFRAIQRNIFTTEKRLYRN